MESKRSQSAGTEGIELDDHASLPSDQQWEDHFQKRKEKRNGWFMVYASTIWCTSQKPELMQTFLIPYILAFKLTRGIETLMVTFVGHWACNTCRTSWSSPPIRTLYQGCHQSLSDFEAVWARVPQILCQVCPRKLQMLVETDLTRKEPDP